LVAGLVAKPAGSDAVQESIGVETRDQFDEAVEDLFRTGRPTPRRRPSPRRRRSGFLLRRSGMADAHRRCASRLDREVRHRL